jgi:3-methyladenine DNA glycosylase/8-oxoguanine DNA glycosylase
MKKDPLRLHEIRRFTLIMPDPFDFSLTVAKPAGWHWSTPRETFEGGTLWTGMYVRNIPVGLKLSAKGIRVHVTVYGEKPPSRDLVGLLKSEVWAALGGDEDLPGFYRFFRDDPILSVVVKHLKGMHMGMARDIFGDVILAILLQMAPWSRSSQMIDSLLEQYGKRIIFDGRDVTLWPRPEELARVDPQELRKTAKLGYRAERLVNAARYLSEHPISPEELSSLPEEEAVRRLTEIPGIGPYSAGIILGTFPIDVWSVVIFSELFLGKTPKNPRGEIAEVVSRLTERWGEWRWFVFVYVVQDLPYLKEKYHLSRVQ